jgi:hypothetical protein
VQFRVPFAAAIFLGSYLPLSLILLAQNFDYASVTRPFCWNWTADCVMPFRNPTFALGIFFGCIVCFAITLAILAMVTPKREIIVRQAKYIPADLMNYVLPYVVSFMSIDYQETGKFIGLLIFLAWMFWITFKSGQIIFNPLLIVFGWRLYDISYNFPGDNTEHSSFALSKVLISPLERYRQTAIQDVMIIKTPVDSED